ncbi:MAG: NAD(P)-dependent oxidoreductase [Saccharofermentans sp.]|nr:NAD(P)-dependent oxidoreductase [Saccharofermentans sp.]
MPDRLQEDLKDFINEPFLAKLKGKTVLVTGATGLIGSALVKTLTCLGDVDVIALIRSKDKADKVFKGTDTSNVSYVICDMNDPKLPSDLKADYIIHCASMTGSKDFVTRPSEVIDTSVRGTRKMLDLARDIKASGFVYLSTMEVYGNGGKGNKISEDHICNVEPSKVRSSYPLSKMMCENLCTCYASEFDLPVNVVRLTQTFGPGVSSSDARLYAYFAKCAIEGRDIVLNTRGETERCYCYLADAVTGILTVLLKAPKGAFYNIATDGSYISVADMAKQVAERFGIGVSFDLTGGKDKGFADTLYIDLDTSALKALGWNSCALPVIDMVSAVADSLKEDMV